MYIHSMKASIDVLTHARRIVTALENMYRDGDGMLDSKWDLEKGDFGHVGSVIYLSGIMAYLEGKYGTFCWNQSHNGLNLDTFIQYNAADDAGLRTQKANFRNAGVSISAFNALQCIRNATLHNNGDLALNRDQSCVSQVSAISLPGVILNGSHVTLEMSGEGSDFITFVKMSFLAISKFFGDLG